jgi:tetratricopeptide (TPR) repeat protein
MLLGRKRLVPLLRQSKARVVVLWGAPGVGKTALAQTLGPTLTLDAHAPLSALPRAKWTLIDDVAEPLKCLERLARVKGARFVVTSRARPTGLLSLDEVGARTPAMVALEVPPLDEADALQLFEVRAREHGIDEVALAQLRGALPEVLEAIDHLPRCVNGLARAAAAGVRFDDLLRFVDALPEDEARELLEPIETVWATLSDGAKSVAMAASVFPARFQVAQLTALVGDARRALSGLQELENAGLISRPTTRPGIKLWFPVKRLARASLGAREGELLERALADASVRAGLEVRAWLPLACALKSPSLVPLVERGAKEALARGSTADASAWLDVALEPDTLVTEPEGRARLLVVRSETRSRLGRAAEALGDAVEALRLCDVFDRPTVAESARQVLLACLVFSGRYRDARQLITENAEVFDSALRRPDFVLRAVGLARYSNGDVDRALGDFEAALPLARGADDVQHELVLEGLLGLMRHERGELDEADVYFDRGVRRAALEGDTYVEAVLRNWQAQVTLERGDAQAALEQFDGARAALEAAGDTRFLRAVDGYRGVTLVQLGRLEEATGSLERSVSNARTSQDGYRLAHFLPHLAFVVRARGENTRAAALFTEARELAIASAHPNLEPVTWLLDEGLASPVAVRKAHARASSSSDVRLAWKVASLRAPEQRKDFEVDVEGRWFVRPDGKRVSLLKRRPLMRIAAALARRADDGLGLTTIEVLRAGWPGEAPQGRSGLQRVYVAINTLRKLGLEVNGGPDGYQLPRGK